MRVLGTLVFRRVHGLQCRIAPGPDSAGFEPLPFDGGGSRRLGRRAGDLAVSEADAQVRCRLAAAKAGVVLWRNNVGAGTLDNGSFIRWGLANESAAVNAHVKSGDLIGIRPVLITPGHVGQTLGVFVSREIKRSGWRRPTNAREIAQQRWIELVTQYGGDAAFSTGDFV